MPRHKAGPMPHRIGPEVIALLEQAETATARHRRHWGFRDRRVIRLHLVRSGGTGLYGLAVADEGVWRIRLSRPDPDAL